MGFQWALSLPTLYFKMNEWGALYFRSQTTSIIPVHEVSVFHSVDKVHLLLLIRQDVAQDSGSDNLVLTHYRTLSPKNNVLLFAGIIIILISVASILSMKVYYCSDAGYESVEDSWHQSNPHHGHLDESEAGRDVCSEWHRAVEEGFDGHGRPLRWQLTPISILGIIGTICGIAGYRIRRFRLKALVAEASGDYETAIIFASKLNDHEMCYKLSQKQEPEPESKHQLTGEQIQQQSEPGSRSTRECPNCGSSCNYDATQCQMCLATLPIMASDRGLGDDGIATSSNPTINVNIQNVQPDSGEKHIHIQDSVITDSDLL